MSVDPVETFVFLPYSKYKALDTRAKKAEGCKNFIIPLANRRTHEHRNWKIRWPTFNFIFETHGRRWKKERQIEKPKLGEDLTKTYRSVQIKKLIAHIERSNGSEGIMALPNLDDLIKLALKNSKKTLRHEEQFFTFLFENNMSHFVKNRSKIDLYYRGDPWYQVWQSIYEK